MIPLLLGQYSPSGPSSDFGDLVFVLLLTLYVLDFGLALLLGVLARSRVSGWPAQRSKCFSACIPNLGAIQPADAAVVKNMLLVFFNNAEHEIFQNVLEVNEKSTLLRYPEFRGTG